ncbi:phosphatase [Paenibacillus marinisediminis]
MSVHQKTSWASLSAAIVVTIYYAVVLIFTFKGNLGLYSTEMMALARNIFGIAIVFQAVMYFINFVSKDEPEDKEIARDVSMRANKTALTFLVFMVASCAFYLIYVSDTQTPLLNPLISAHLLVSILLAAWIVKHIAELVVYHRSYSMTRIDKYS